MDGPFLVSVREGPVFHFYGVHLLGGECSMVSTGMKCNLKSSQKAFHVPKFGDNRVRAIICCL